MIINALASRVSLHYSKLETKKGRMVRMIGLRMKATGRHTVAAVSALFAVAATAPS